MSLFRRVAPAKSEQVSDDDQAINTAPDEEHITEVQTDDDATVTTHSTASDDCVVDEVVHLKRSGFRVPVRCLRNRLWDREMHDFVNHAVI